MGNERSELSVAYVTSVPPTPLCTYWPGSKCPSSSWHFKEEVFYYFIFQHRTHVRQEPDVLSQKPNFAPRAWFLNRRPTVTSKSPPFFAQKSWVGIPHATSKTKVTGHTPALTPTWCLTPPGALLSWGLSPNGLLSPTGFSWFWCVQCELLIYWDTTEYCSFPSSSSNHVCFTCVLR